MMTELRNFRILIVYAHPADIACEGAGTVALHAERGDEITALLLSDGERHHNDLIYRERAKPEAERDPGLNAATVETICALKRREAEQMCEVLGIKRMISFGWPDVIWPVCQEKVAQMAEAIYELRPEVVLTHMPLELIPQMNDVHAVAGQLTRLAIRYCSDSLPQIDGREPHHTKLLFYYPMGGVSDTSFMLGHGIVCDTWVDITPVIEKKIRAMDCLISQGYQGHAARKIVESREGRWGMLAGCSYAEPWMRDRAARYQCLPVRPEDLEKGYTPNDLPGETLLCQKIPMTAPPDLPE